MYERPSYSFWHKLNDKTHCYSEKCCEKNIDTCQNCQSPILGYNLPSGIITMGPEKFSIPAFCKDCSKAYPWTKRILSNAIELLSIDEELDSQTKEFIKKAIPDLLIDTPKTPIAVVKYKINIQKVSKVVKDGMYNLLVDVLSERIKKSVFDSDS